MPQRTKEEFLNDFSELKNNMKIARKMFKDGYDNEVKELKTMEKILKSGLKGKEVVTEDYLSIGLIAINRQLQRINNNHHMMNGLILNNAEKTMESVLVVNGIIEILGDFTRDTSLKSVQTKVKKLQKFQNDIIKKVKQKQTAKSVNAYVGVR